jgi:hypothetical protein
MMLLLLLLPMQPLLVCTVLPCRGPGAVRVRQLACAAPPGGPALAVVA